MTACPSHSKPCQTEDTCSGSTQLSPQGLPWWCQSLCRTLDRGLGSALPEVDWEAGSRMLEASRESTAEQHGLWLIVQEAAHLAGWNVQLSLHVLLDVFSDNFRNVRHSVKGVCRARGHPSCTLSPGLLREGNVPDACATLSASDCEGSGSLTIQVHQDNFDWLCWRPHHVEPELRHPQCLMSLITGRMHCIVIPVFALHRLKRPM